MKTEIQEVFNALDRLLAALPANGNKAVIGMAVKALLPVFVSFFPQALLAAPFLDAAANVVIAIGLAHKGVKAVKESKENK